MHVADRHKATGKMPERGAGHDLDATPRPYQSAKNGLAAIPQVVEAMRGPNTWATSAVGTPTP